MIELTDERIRKYLTLFRCPRPVLHGSGAVSYTHLDVYKRQAVQTKELRDQMDDNFRDLIQWLLFGLVDFDFISESLLPGQCPDRMEECLNGTGVIRETPDGAALAAVSYTHLCRQNR